MSGSTEPATQPFLYDRSDMRALAELQRPRIIGCLFGLMWVLFALLAFLIALCWFAGSTRTLKYVPISLILLAAALLLHRFGPDIRAWALEFAARKSGLHMEQVMTAAADVFRAESERGKTEVRWKAIPRLERTEDRLFVFSTPRLAYIIPRRAFDADDAFDQFVAVVQERWKAHHPQ